MQVVKLLEFRTCIYSQLSLGHGQQAVVVLSLRLALVHLKRVKVSIVASLPVAPALAGMSSGRNRLKSVLQTERKKVEGRRG